MNRAGPGKLIAKSNDNMSHVELRSEGSTVVERDMESTLQPPMVRQEPIADHTAPDPLLPDLATSYSLTREKHACCELSLL